MDKLCTHRGTYLNCGLHRPPTPPTGTQKLMKHCAWKEENKPFPFPVCTGLCYRVTVFINSPRGRRKLWCTHTYLAALKIEGVEKKKREKETKKKIFLQISETHIQRHTPHLHPKQLLKLFYTAAAPLGEVQPLPQRGISSAIWA